ncbi:MAG: hypothetical protein ACYC5N_08855, partial [Endomicrobiales bacterium]
QGYIRSARVLVDGAAAAEQELKVIRTGKERAAAKEKGQVKTKAKVEVQVQGEVKEKEKVRTETYLRVGENGMLVFNGEALACFKGLPGSEVQVIAEDGRAVFLLFSHDRDGKPVLDRDGRPLMIEFAKDVDAQVEENLFDARRKRMQELELLYDAAEEAYRAGAYEEAARGFGSVIERVKDGEDKDGREEYLAWKAGCYLNNCRLFAGRQESSPELRVIDLAERPARMSAREFAALEHAVIRGVRLDPRGYVSIAGRRWAKFTDRAGSPAELEVRQGFVAGVSFPDGESRALAAVEDNASGRMIDTFSEEFNAARMSALADATLKGVRLHGYGDILLGSRHWGRFLAHANETADVTVKDGVVSRVFFPADGSETDFFLIRDDRTGKAVDSFYAGMTAKKLASLDGVTIEGWSFDPTGRLSLGGRTWARNEERAGEKVAVSVEKGIVTSLTLADGTREEFSRVCDADGTLIDSYYQLLGRIPEGMNAVIRKDRLDSNGFLKIGGGFVCNLSRYPSAEIEIAVNGGKVTSVTLVRDRAGSPVLDVDGEPLELDVRRDIKQQIAAKSLDAHRKRFIEARERYYAGLRLFAEGRYREARQAFASVVSRMAGRRASFETAAALGEKALFYMELCSSLPGGREAQEAAQDEKVRETFLKAEGFFARRDYREALRHFRYLVRNAPEGSGARVAAEKRAPQCATQLRCAEAEQLFLDGEHKKALLRFNRLLKEEGQDPAVSELAARRAGESRAFVKYAYAQKRFRRHDYEGALKVINEVLETGDYGTDVYLAAKELLEECRHKILIKQDEAGSLAVIRRYSSAAVLDIDKRDGLLRRLAALSEDGPEAVEARRKLAESSLPLVMEAAKRSAEVDSDYYSDLLSEGFLCLYGAVHGYARERGRNGLSFDKFAAAALAERFDVLRKERNKALFGEISLSKPVGVSHNRSGEPATLEDFIATTELSPEESTMDVDELDQVRRVMQKFPSPRDKLMIWRVAAEGEDAQEASQEFGASVEEVRAVLAKALSLMREPSSLGENLRLLVSAAMGTLKEQEPASLLLRALARRSTDLASQLFELYRAGRNVTERYEEYASLLREEEGVGQVEVWESGYLAREDAWSYAAAEPLMTGDLKLLVNKVFLDALKADGPPESFEPALERGEREKKFLALLARHEADEEAALRPRTAGAETLRQHPWLPGFDAYLAKNGLPRASSSFHGYLLSLGQNGAALSGEEKLLAAQAALLSFARAIPRAGARARQKQENPSQEKGGRQFRIYDSRTGALVRSTDRLRGDEFARLTHHTIKNFFAGAGGEVKVGGKYICGLTNHPGAELELEIQDGIVTLIRIMKDGAALEEKSLALIYDRATGALVDSCDKVSKKRLSGLSNHLIRNLSTSGSGIITVGGEYVGETAAYPEAPVELTVEQGLVTAVRVFKDGQPVYDRALSLVYDDAAGKPVLSFNLLTRAQMKKLQRHTIKRFFTDSSGRVALGGEDVCRLTNYPNAEVELSVEQGVVTAVRVMEGGATVHEKKLSLIYDNASGALAGSFDNLTGER